MLTQYTTHYDGNGNWSVKDIETHEIAKIEGLECSKLTKYEALEATYYLNRRMQNDLRHAIDSVPYR